jgi:electron transfer flavoprotein beta subunit
VAFNSVVLVKQVPDTKNITGQAMLDDGTVNRAALPAVFNPEDLNALESALALRDRCGGTVTVMTMGPPSACEILRDSLSRGADRAILLTDRRAAASDTLATSYILSCAVRKLSDVHLVFCGRQAIDGDTAQVGPQLAEKLNFPQVTYVEEILDVSDSTLRMRRNLGDGYELVEAPVPLLITIVDTANTPRPPAARRMLKYKRARGKAELAKNASEKFGKDAADDIDKFIKVRTEELSAKGLLIEQWGLDEIEADLSWCGRSGSPTKVHRIQSVVLTGNEHKQIEPTPEAISQMVHELIEDHTIG